MAGCAAALVLGALDVAVHGLAPPSSWITYGACIAAAVALGLGPLARSLPTRRRRLLGFGLAVVLVVPALPAALALLINTQRLQRTSYRFIATLAGRGYHPEGGLSCHQVARLPIVDRATVERRFAGSDEPHATRRFLEALRASGARFLLASYQFGGLPRPLRRMLRERFIRFRGAVLLPGMHLDDIGASKRFFAFVSGQYRLDVVEGHKPVSIEIDGCPLWDGDVISLPAGEHHVEVFDQPILGSLVLDVGARYEPGRFRFYERSALVEFAGDAWHVDRAR